MNTPALCLQWNSLFPLWESRLLSQGFSLCQDMQQGHPEALLQKKVFI